MVPLPWNYLLILFFLTLKMTIKLKVLSSQSERTTWYSFRTVDRKQQLLSMLGLSILQALAHKKQMRRTLSSLCSMLLTELGQYFKQVVLHPHQHNCLLASYIWPCSSVGMYLTQVLLLPFFKKLQFNRYLSKVKVEFSIRASLSPPSNPGNHDRSDICY